MVEILGDKVAANVMTSGSSAQAVEQRTGVREGSALSSHSGSEA